MKTQLPVICFTGTLLVSLGIAGCQSGSSPVSTGSGGSSGGARRFRGSLYPDGWFCRRWRRSDFDPL